MDSKRVLTICHATDNICAGGDIVGLAHLDYAKNAGQAAMFALGGVAMMGITSEKMKFKAVNSIGS